MGLRPKQKWGNGAASPAGRAARPASSVSSPGVRYVCLKAYRGVAISGRCQPRANTARGWPCWRALRGKCSSCGFCLVSCAERNKLKKLAFREKNRTGGSKYMMHREADGAGPMVASRISALGSDVIIRVSSAVIGRDDQTGRGFKAGWEGKNQCRGRGRRRDERHRPSAASGNHVKCKQRCRRNNKQHLSSMAAIGEKWQIRRGTTEHPAKAGVKSGRCRRGGGDERKSSKGLP